MRTARFGDLFRLERIPLEPDPSTAYVQIGIRSFGKGIFHRDPVSADGLSKLKYFHLKPNRIVFSNIMAWEGAIAITGPGEAGTIGSQRFLSYEPISDEVDLRYYNYFFQTEIGRSLVRSASTGTVKRNQTLSPRAIEQFIVPFPTLEEQRRIASFLDASAEAILALEQRGSTSLETAAKLVERLILGPWPQESIGNAVDRISRPVSVEPDTIYSMLGVRWYGGGVFTRESRLGSGLSARTVYRVEQGDFLYNRLFAWKGAFAVVGPEHHGSYVSNEFPVYRGKEGRLLTEYLYVVCSAPSFMNRALRRSRGATTTSRNRLREDDFENMTIALPPISVQKEVVRIRSKISRYQELCERRQTLGSALRAAMLNAAFNGML